MLKFICPNLEVVVINFDLITAGVLGGEENQGFSEEAL